MNGLRIYIDLVGAEGPGGHVVFYSRRADGPYYRWGYAEGPGQWRVSRVRLSDSTLRALRIASWRAVPTALRARLSEHYLE